ncbi:MAG: hypothetical protein ACTSR1_01010 [Candidatus Heimdallarchaeota archaeon]
METIKGIIEKVDMSSGVGKNGKPYTRWVFIVNGKNYSTFDKKHATNHKPGDAVLIKGEINEDGYFDMKEMEKIEGNDIEEVKKVAQNGSIEAKTYPKDPVGLATEIFTVIRGLFDLDESNEKIMAESIKVVKQAQEAFN